MIQAIVEAADASGATVLEIGPGEGVLTERLAEVATHVVAVDVDSEAIQTTRERVEGKPVTLVEQDVLDKRLPDVRDQLPESFVLVGNLPYNITSPLLRWMLTTSPKPDRAVVMVQKEVADKLLADAGDLSLLGLMVQVYASVRPVVQVPRGAFAPPPKVDSTVVALDVLSDADLEAQGRHVPEKLLAFAKVAFAQKRKQLVSTLGSLPDISKEALKQALVDLGYPPTARPQELSCDAWIALYNQLHDYCEPA